MTKKTATKKKAPAQQSAVIEAFKGFDNSLRCSGGGAPFQYEIGKTYEHQGGVRVCSSGFHACTNPVDVFAYYEPALSRFALVELSGELSRHDEDSKIAAGRITIKAELSLPEVVAKAIAVVTSLCGPDSSHHATGYRSASSATGYRSASSATGDSSASSATGGRSASSATGDSSASSATGDRSASSATGDSSASSVNGIAAVAMNIGRGGRAKAAEGGAIVLCSHNDDGTLRHIRASKVGENGVKPDIPYTLDDAGEFVEVK